MARIDLDAEQTDAILELKLYRLARLRSLRSGRSSTSGGRAKQIGCCSTAR